MRFEVKIRFQCLNPHPIFQVAKLEHKFTHAPFIVRYIDFNRNPTLPDLTFVKSCFIPHTQASNTLYILKTHMFIYSTQIRFYTLLCNIFLFSHAIPFELTDTDNILPPDDPYITSLWFLITIGKTT